MICAKGRSKGLPGKKIKLLDGVPLICRSIMIAKQINTITRVVVSTDSGKIAELTIEYGEEDTSREWLV